MVYKLKQLLYVLTISLGTSSLALSTEKPTMSEQFPLLLKMYTQTDLNISEPTFKKFDTKTQVLYLGMYCIDFEQKGITKQSVINYVSFLRALFPHLKTDTTIWDKLTKRYGHTKKAIVAIEAAHLFLKPFEKKTYEELEKEYCFAKELEIRAFKETTPSQKVKLYEESLSIWERIHKDTDYNNDSNFQNLHYQSVGKKFDLKRLIRVAKKSIVNT